MSLPPGAEAGSEVLYLLSRSAQDSGSSRDSWQAAALAGGGSARCATRSGRAACPQARKPAGLPHRRGAAFGR